MAAPSREMCRKFLFQCAYDHIDFLIPELKSISGIFGINFTIPDGYDPNETPFLVLDLPSEDCARKIMGRTTLVKSVYELWGQGSNEEELFHNLGQIPTSFKKPFWQENNSFRVIVDSFNKLISMTEKIKRIERLLTTDAAAFDIPCKLNLKKPDFSFHWFEHYGSQNTPSPDEPFIIYFGRWLADGQRENIKKYDLKTRKFIGNTSMDPGLSLIMANMAHVQPGDLIMDPFVGTGSLLVAASHHGAYVMGTDIDFQVIHGRGRASRHNQKWRGENENIHANLTQYGLQHLYIDALVADASLHNLWRPQTLFDAIITDPPYGVREPTMRLGSNKVDPTVADEHKEGHVPSKVNYDMSEMMRDLLDFAAKFLRLGGRLVFWIPIYTEEYNESIIPCHPCLELLFNSEQPLSGRISRRLLTMVKLHEWDDKMTSGAETIENHYETPFRDRYFTPQKRQAEKNQLAVKIRRRSASHSAGEEDEDGICDTNITSADTTTADTGAGEAMGGISPDAETRKEGDGSSFTDIKKGGQFVQDTECKQENSS